MKRHQGRFGRKEHCPCSLKKKKFAPLFDELGNRTGGGKCWSPSCGRKFFRPSSVHHKPHSEQNSQPKTRRHIYQSETGENHIRITVKKYPNGDKRAFADHWTGTDWSSGLGGALKLPYRLPEVMERVALGGLIVIVEGEKDADRASELGFTATCNPFGAGKWLDPMSEYLSGATVVIIQDNDQAGKDHAQQVKKSLLKAGAHHVAILDLTTLEPNLIKGGDLSDYLDNGGNVAVLRAAVNRSGAAGSTPGRIINPPNIPLDELPDGLRKLLSGPLNDLQRTALLATALTVIGSILPNVKTYYHGKHYSPALFLFVVGPPGSGKGALLPALKLVQSVHDELTRRSAEALKNYHRQLRERSKEDTSAPPEEPKREILIVPADSTGPVIVRGICENPGLLLFDSEADTINTALRADTGSISSVLRKVWQQEPISRARSRDGEYKSTDTPHFAMVLTGTPDQVVSLTTQVANGLLSRLSFIEFPPQRQYRDPFDEAASAPYTAAETLAKYVKDLWAYLNRPHMDNEYSVVLTDSQKQRFGKHFGKTYEDMIEDWDSATTLRAGIVAVRLATILTALRHWLEHSALESRMIVSETDFNLAMTLAEYLRKNTNSMIERVEATKADLRPAPEKRKAEWYRLLPDEFDTRTAYQIAELVGVSRSTIHRIMRSDPRIENVARSKYRKTRGQSDP